MLLDERRLLFCVDISPSQFRGALYDLSGYLCLRGAKIASAPFHPCKP